MVDFRFDIKPLFPQAIVKVTSNLLPHTFRGDRRQCLDATSKMSEIIDRLGQLSAVSQGLNHPVTTAQRLRMSDNQIIYLLADTNAGQNGTVTGLLKVGTKDLYLFDELGQTRKVESAPSILDFYVHESRQRTGLGKHLFETMLSEEQWTPIKCSVDRPSEKLLGFLRKHYGLVKTIPQANNFVLYEGFFDNGETKEGRQQTNGNGLHITNSPNTQLFGATYLGDDANRRRNGGQQNQQQLPTPNALLQQITQISPVGRYGAKRPTCSMAESRHGSGGGGGAGIKKLGSQASLTPSQAAQRDLENSRKSPLDALSRNTLRQDVIQKRSGLQDVDDSWLDKNTFLRPSRMRHSGLDDSMPAYAQNQRQPQQGATAPPILQAKLTPIRAAGGEQQHVPAQQQPQAVQEQQSQAAAPAAVQPAAQQQASTAQSGTTAATPAATHSPRQQQQPAAAHGHSHEQHGQSHANEQGYRGGQEPGHPPQAPPKYQKQQQQKTYNQSQGDVGRTGGINVVDVQPPPEAEMCTTCPNCQTTIYLVRAPETGCGDMSSQIIGGAQPNQRGGADPNNKFYTNHNKAAN